MDSSLDHWLGIQPWHLRIHTSEDMPVVETFVKETNPTFYIISRENATRDHYHILFRSQIKEHTLRARIKTRFGTEGNKIYSLSQVRSEKQLRKYVLKDNNQLKYYGVDQEEIDMLRKLSFKKGKDKLMEEIDQVLEKYYSDEYDDIDLVENVIKIKSAYGQNLYANHIKAWFHSKKVRKTPSYAREYAQTIIGYF